MTDHIEKSRAAFEYFLRARGFDTTIYGDGNYADEVMNLHAAWLAAIFAERERCAKIAESMDCAMRCRVGWEVAAAIRGTTTD